MALVFGSALVAVLVAGVVLSKVMAEPNCTEGPCAQDVVLVATFGWVAFIIVAWIVSAISTSHDKRRDQDR
jgi:biotin transporter BioY